MRHLRRHNDTILPLLLLLLVLLLLLFKQLDGEHEVQAAVVAADVVQAAVDEFHLAADLLGSRALDKLDRLGEDTTLGAGSDT